MHPCIDNNLINNLLSNLPGQIWNHRAELLADPKLKLRKKKMWGQHEMKMEAY